MTAPLAIQLYTVRERLAHDFEGTMRALADIGYLGVETAAFPEGVSARQAAELFQELDLTVTSAHVPLPLDEQQQPALDTAAALGCKRLVVNYLPPEQFASLEQIRRTAGRLNEAAAAVGAAGYRLGYHNHQWEFWEVGDTGRVAFDVLQEQLDPDLFFEIDIYWVRVGGQAPTYVLKEVGARAPLLHIKDGPINEVDAMTAVGAGAIDVPGAIGAAGDHPEWLIVELDRCATDMMEAVAQSYRYLTAEGLGRGREA